MRSKLACKFYNATGLNKEIKVDHKISVPRFSLDLADNIEYKFLYIFFLISTKILSIILF